MSEAERCEVECNRLIDVGLSADNHQMIAVRFGEDVKSMTLEMAEVLAVQLLRTVQYRRESIRMKANFYVAEEYEQLQPADFEKARADASFLRNYERVQSRAYNQTYRSKPKETSSEN